MNGEDIDIEQLPFVAGLINLATKIVFCGGTIISPRFIVSVAHCFDNRTISDIGCLVGMTDYSKPQESRFGATYRIDGVHNYPGYDRTTMLNDIAIIKTVGDMQFNPAVSAACMPMG